MAAAAILSILSVCFLSPGVSAQRANASEHVVPLAQFVQRGGILDSPGEGRGESTEFILSLTFPRFDVYSPRGDLIYRTVDLDELRHFLRHFPRSSRFLRPISGADNWSSIAAKFHLAEPTAKSPPTRGDYIFLSLLLVNCNACSSERYLLESMNNRLAERHVHQEILVLSP